jgi:hypothetical protein
MKGFVSTSPPISWPFIVNKSTIGLPKYSGESTIILYIWLKKPL